MSKIQTEADYYARFPIREDPKLIGRSKALVCALDIRKFEIELYWKRAGYFWTLIAASFVAFFTLQSSCIHAFNVFLVSCIGLLLSLGWYLANRGSKYWQENWERHVDLLESDIIGPLFKTTISPQEYPFLKFWHGYPYSVSRINQIISLFVVLIWLGLAIMAWQSTSRSLWRTLLVCCTALFAVLLLTLGKGGSGGKPRPLNFSESPVAPTTSANEAG